MCSTKCPTEISLSNDLLFSEISLDSNSEFEFCVSGSFECESSSADELFFNGVIVPTQNQQRFVKIKQTHHCSSLPPLPPTPENHPRKPEEFVHVGSNSECEKKSGSKSFWGFGRSNSVSFDSRKGSLFSLPLLSRSNSTGSVKSQSSQLLKQHSVSEGKSKSSSSNSAAHSYSKLQKSQKKNHGGFYGKNLQVNHIFNVKETANIFGLNSLLRGSKEKKSKK